MYVLKVAKLLLPAICLAIFVTSVAHLAFADTIQQCVAETCKGGSRPVSLADFIALEKKDHPRLEELYSRYQNQVDQIRLARERQARESLRIISETQKLTDLIRHMPDHELMSLFIESQPWNFARDRANGTFVVVPEPLTANIEQREVIKQIFPRLQAVSPLYAAQLEVVQLKADPHSILKISDTQKIEPFVIDMIKSRIAQGDSSIQKEYSQKLDKTLSRMSSLKNQFGEKIYLSLGSLDLALQVKLGQVAFIGNERSIIEQVMIDEIPGVIEAKKDGIEKIDEVYSQAVWEKTCRLSYNRALHYGLSQEEKDRLENQLKPEALRRSQGTIQGLFGRQLAAEIMSHVGSMNINGPMSLSEYLHYIEQSMQTSLKEAQRKDLSLIERHQIVTNLGDGQDGVIQNFCGSWIFEPIRDSVSGNNIFLSAYSTKNYSVGLSISIHEMGHAASLALDLLKRDGFSIAPFEEIRACISKNYANSNQKPSYDDIHFDADKLWTEEDWADAFAAHSTQDMEVNNMCGTLGVKPQSDYLRLAERTASPHSPTFYRILNIDAHLGNPPANQCSKPLLTEFQGMAFKDCISSFIRK